MSATPILNGPQVPTHILWDFVANRPLTLKANSVAKLEELTCAYTAYGALTGIGNLLPFAQAVKETARFTSPRWRQSNNPAGLGATDDGAWGNVFPTPSAGILAQFAHLLSYAVPTNQRPSIIHGTLMALDPRIQHMSKLFGSAPNWEQLGGKWSTGAQYGISIVTLAQQIWSF